ncbi:hypothetical protein Lal_00004469 [Lupinus albus]|uniref:Protein cereblon n=1 Tax=Lupinus albus TaxID=3870 RepID=A0A6A5M276_LUPAL|nr:putative Lon, substrate-binding domain, PUA-like domain-containing protein [Lupinus albus]KAF1865095.1 hypothetical protein Lal_00004469 [Lupinus albus]
MNWIEKLIKMVEEEAILESNLHHQLAVEEFNFDTCLSSLHTYLGDVEDTRHRTAFLDADSVFNLPLFSLQGVVLFPGATLPLRVVEPPFVAAIERALAQVDVPYTIGVIRTHWDTANRGMKLASIGTTAEIRQYVRLEDGSLNVVTCGQQRFRLRRRWRDAERVPYGEIQITEEDVPLRTPQGAFGKLGPLSNRPRSHAISHMLSSRAFWPQWVFHMFDSYCLAERVADMWKQIVGAPRMDSLVKKPDVLSFYIASKIPVSESTRQELLDIDGITYRLRREIELLASIDLIRCKSCQTIIAERSDMLVMSSEGPLGAYVNPGGYVHEIMTLYKADGITPVGPSATEYSWFPGYAWTIAKCSTCKTQLGWLFTATKIKLKPSSFWGIRSCQVAEEICRNL